MIDGGGSKGIMESCNGNSIGILSCFEELDPRLPLGGCQALGLRRQEFRGEFKLKGGRFTL